MSRKIIRASGVPVTMTRARICLDVFAEQGLIALRRADVWGSGIETGPVATADRWERVLMDMERRGAPFSEKELAVTGADIMEALSIPAGPKVGSVKAGLLLHCARVPEDNRRDKLLKIARDLVNNS